MRRNTEAQQRARAKWEAEKAERRGIKIRKEYIDRINAAAQKVGKSFNRFCVEAVLAAVEEEE